MQSFWIKSRFLPKTSIISAQEVKKMAQNNNVVGWFEIPAVNMERAIKFYENVFGFKLTRHQIGPLDMAWFPWVEGGSGASGSLVKKGRRL
jgi:predicted enzyme related to lactoylglutathione lyase